MASPAAVDVGGDGYRGRVEMTWTTYNGLAGIRDRLPDDSTLRATFGAPTVERGLDYAARGRVQRLQVETGGRLLYGTVAGSGGRPYQTVVVLDGALGVSSSCTCPVGAACKHGVAVLAAARDRASSAARSAGQSDWERALAAVVGPANEHDAGTPLGLQFEYITGRHGPTRDSSARRVRIRPVVQGKTGRWVMAGIAWRDIQHAYRYSGHVGEHVEALKALIGTWDASRSYGSADPNVFLDDFGPALWPLLRDVVHAGVELIPHKSITGPVLLSEASAELGLDLTRHRVLDGTSMAGTATVGPLLAGPAALSIVGRPAHGVVVDVAAADVVPGHDGAAPALATRAGILLAPLARRLSSQASDVVSAAPVRIPPADLDRFRREFYPQLRGVVPVGSSDGSVDLPQITPPTLLLRLSYGHHLELEWFFRYDVEGTVTGVPIDAAEDDAGPPRDPHGEDRLLAGLDLPTDLLPQLRAAPPGVGPAARLRLSALSAAAFTEDVLPRLRHSPDLVVETVGEVPDYKLSHATPVIEVSATDTDDADWFDLGVRVQLDGEQVPFRELFRALAAGDTHLMLLSGTYFAIDRPEFDQLRRLIAEASDLQDTRPEDGLRVSAFQTGLWEELAELGVVAEQSTRWQQTVARLTAGDDLVEAELPAGVNATLRPYQLDGYRWLSMLWQAGLGGVLADDMGLGKTLQTLAAIAREKETGRLTAPVLVVAPTSVVGGWASEAARFTPGLRVVTIGRSAGAARRTLADKVGDADVVITSYALLRIDFDSYDSLDWSALVLDEAQFVKNYQAKTYQCARRLRARFKLAITGTPLENSLMDLWSLMSIAAPGVFPDPKRFTETYRKPIERGEGDEQLATLRRRIAPFIRRRTKEEVAPELPEKQEHILTVTLNDRHRKIYDTHLQQERRKILGLVDELDKNRFTIFRSLTLLRQLSLDPGLVDEKYADVSSSKADAFMEHLEEVIAEGHRALVFSQFTGFLATVRARLEADGVDYAYLDGRSTQRARRINEFKTGEAPVFLISLKAGGFGLNLTEADYVFMLDPWWNPAVEAQAVDRTHRIGQDRKVMVYRLVAEGTIEEKVMALKERKQNLFDQVMGDDALLSAPLTADDIRDLLAG
ncbi:DEAD/DEAH box helicase [Georgenia sp. MJ170]|uniref:DEAD/DEAH box helicase n=1 Tax=Georgenia sunbinii TaxID=3117728 RepID=UPI002F269934